ncbi:hypothetical protein DFH09DRAFT_1090351 [Mycena vulgaris]|nr:hypothetical protein DFH09DRAFT_1090351 [Mycena vulgaris]
MSLTPFEYAANINVLQSGSEIRARAARARKDTEVDRIRTPGIEVVFPASGSVWLQACLEREGGVSGPTSDSLGTAGLVILNKYSELSSLKNTFVDPFERRDSNPGSRAQSTRTPFDRKRARSVQYVRLIGVDTNLAILQTNQSEETHGKGSKKKKYALTGFERRESVSRRTCRTFVKSGRGCTLSEGECRPSDKLVNPEQRMESLRRSHDLRLASSEPGIGAGLVYTGVGRF